MAPTTQQSQCNGATPELSVGTRSATVARGVSKPNPEQTQIDQEKKIEAQRQAWFENTVKDCLKIPNNYIEAAVLIIRWNPDIDAFAKGHTSEIAELRKVFRDSFGFTIANEVHLSSSKQAQNTLNNAITQLVEDYDGPNKLLIVYYTGHGMLSSGDLHLTATEDPIKNAAGKYPAKACWGTAERPLRCKTLEADVLAILDCCFASSAHKGHNSASKIYELLAACPKDEPTIAPGPNSFTRHLIDTLKKLVGPKKDQRILTTKLVAALNEYDGTHAELHDRLKRDDRRHVQLTPVVKRSEREAKREVKALQSRPPELAVVKMSFSLRQRDLTQTQIERWAKQLIKASDAADVPLRQIDWVQMSKTTFKHVVEAALKDSRRKSLTSEALQQGTSSILEKRPPQDDSILTPSKRHAHGANSMPEAHQESGLLTPRQNDER